MGLTAGGGGGSAQLTIKSVAAAAYTLQLSDAANVEVQATSAAAVEVTIPPDSEVEIPIGSVIHVTQIGAGQVTIAPGEGVTLSSARSYQTRAQFSRLALEKTAADTWVMYGDMADANGSGIQMIAACGFVPPGTLTWSKGLTVTRLAAGNYRFTFDVPRPDTNYNPHAEAREVVGVTDANSWFRATSAKTVDYFDVWFADTGSYATGADPSELWVTVFA